MKTMMVINTVREIAELKVMESDGSIQELGFISWGSYDILKDGKKKDVLLTRAGMLVGHFVVDSVGVI